MRLHNNFNSLNFYRNGELSRNQIGRSGIRVKKANKKFTVVRSCSPHTLKRGHFTLLFYRGRQRNVLKCFVVSSLPSPSPLLKLPIHQFSVCHFIYCITGKHGENMQVVPLSGHSAKIFAWHPKKCTLRLVPMPENQTRAPSPNRPKSDVNYMSHVCCLVTYWSRGRME